MSAANRKKQWLALVGWVALCFGAAAFGGMFGPGEWYASLRKPSWNPPNWIFGPVWTMLYIMMAVAAWRVWRFGSGDGRQKALGLFFAQLCLNAAWTPLFFGLKHPALAFGDIVLLWLSLGATTVAFFKMDRVAGWLMVPYLAWVSFAAVLNAVLWRMNP
ncbi:MAG: tryptophan-rich sensory protein [Verrucomicrobia bacterium]|nr:tryptophan-rich sensory protein [Verrucomicrobiota bacterium]